MEITSYDANSIIAEKLCNIQSIKKCYISSELDGDEEDALWNPKFSLTLTILLPVQI